MMTKEGSSKIVNFMTPRAAALVLGHGHISHIEKMHHFFKKIFKSSSLLQGTDQTNLKYIVMMTKKGPPNCNFHDPRGVAI